MQKAFVVGATGYTGRAVVGELIRCGVTTIAHVRPDSPSLSRWCESFGRLGARVDSTPWELQALIERMADEQPSHVFALLGTTRARAHRAGMRASEAYEKIDYGLTVMVLEAVSRAAPAARFVYLSAIGAGPSRSAYMAARWKAEQAIQASGVTFTIVRPSFVTGSDRDESRPAERVAARMSDALLKVLVPLGGGHLRDRYRSMTGHELAQAMVRLAFDPEAGNRVFESEELH